uniref:4Fe-4S cluster-binding domain-containing protein n=1 Tax=Paenibacillus sp. FSL W7-1279 TaxID=2921697 RepID=UPI00403F5BD9
MKVHIFVTNDCNLSCDYCYVSGLREKLYFSPALVSSLITFINNVLKLNKSENVTLNFFGGEPLQSQGHKY